MLIHNDTVIFIESRGLSMKKTFVKVLSVLLVGSAFLTPVESIAAGKTIGAYKCTKYSTAKGSNVWLRMIS